MSKLQRTIIARRFLCPCRSKKSVSMQSVWIYSTVYFKYLDIKCHQYISVELQICRTWYQNILKKTDHNESPILSGLKPYLESDSLQFIEIFEWSTALQNYKAVVLYNTEYQNIIPQWTSRRSQPLPFIENIWMIYSSAGLQDYSSAGLQDCRI